MEVMLGESKEKILKERAMMLATEVTDQTEEGSIEVTQFKMANEVYGIETRYIKEVHPLKAYTSLPGTPSFVFGIMNIRGKILSIVNLKKFFQLPDAGLSDLNKVIVLHHDDMELGILADEIIGVRSIKNYLIEKDLPTLTEVRADYLVGVTEERVVVLDGEKFLTDSRIVVYEEVE